MLLSWDYRSISRCSNPRRYFFILLLLNSLLACIYYLHEQTFSTYLLKQSMKKIFPSIQNSAIDYLRKTLQDEYNPDDLLRFYQTVEKEFSLGLRCMRESPSSIISNETNNETNRLIRTLPLKLIPKVIL